jgi:intein/homing endonuclease
MDSVDQNTLIAYLFGALHDGTFNRRHKTWRISQSDVQWLERLRKIFNNLGYRAWIYREGKKRTVSVIETTAGFLNDETEPAKFSSVAEQVAYIRGYFDAEGGIPRNDDHWMYIQLSQKNKDELEQVKKILEKLGITVGKIHNPSQNVDPEYWRFFISRQSHQDFIKIVGSWHPSKERILANRLKIYEANASLS